MEKFLELLAPISIYITAGLLLLQNVIEIRQEREEAKIKEAKEAHEEIKRRWKKSI